MNDNKPLTVEDVAEEAGVSTATVSRVFNRSAKVSEKTVQKVLKAAEKLDYRPNRVARRLRVKSSQSMIIGLIVTDLENPFFSEIARGVEDIAYKSKNAVMVCNSDEKGDKERFYIDTLLAERASGLIAALTPHNASYIQELVDRGYPVVCVDRHQSIQNVDTVTVNNISGAYQAVTRLIDLGHKRIGIINGLPDISTTEERFEGYKKALSDHNITFDPKLVMYGNSRQDGGIEKTRELLKLKDRPTAVFITNNLMTLGFLEEMYKQGLNIPEDMALIGFDDMPWSVALNPPLTAVKQPGYELGTRAAELLFKRLEQSSRATSSIVLNPKLIVRKSCGENIS